MIFKSKGNKGIIGEEKRLIISCLGIKKSILYDDINNVSEENGSLTIQAIALPQVWLFLNNNKIVKISPDDREKFINILNHLTRMN